jgi:hypothetical protein
VTALLFENLEEASLNRDCSRSSAGRVFLGHHVEAMARRNKGWMSDKARKLVRRARETEYETWPTNR